MTSLKFWQFDIKAFFRAPQWEVAIVAKIFMAIFGAYLFLSVMAIGVGAYYVLQKEFPNETTIDLINKGVFFIFLIEAILRYFFQNLPNTQVQYWILLPIKKRLIINNLLFRSLLSPFNFIPWLLYFPVAVVRIIEEGMGLDSFVWFFQLLFLSLILNFLIFLINKNTKVLITSLALMAIGIGIEIYSEFSFYKNFAKAIYWAEQYPLSVLIAIFLLAISYKAVYQFLKARFYLDMGLAKKPEKMLRLGFSFLGGYGRLGVFLKNDLRLLLRNTRPKQILLFSVMFLFYGLVFFTTEIYKENSLLVIFASLFVTAGFSMTYGQQVPAWDSEYFGFLMTQNLTYREYLESKWRLMAVSVFLSLILSSFYLLFGWKIYLIIMTTAIYNIGVGSFVNLYSGAFNRVPIKLNVKANTFSNTKAFSLTQLLFTIPKLGLPIFIFFIADFIWGGKAGLFSLAFFGGLGIVFKHYILNHLAKIYTLGKHKTIAAFTKN